MIEESHITRLLETCRHFNGTQNPKCEAGIHYTAFTDPGIPCIARFNKSNQTCARHALSTREEIITQIEADDAAYGEAIQRMAAVAPAVNACRKLAGRTGGRYEQECQACGTGRLHIAIAPNGHARVSCTTDGCVHWIE